jgi:uncharacterized protein YaaW (UPF0174 family)
MERRRRKMAIYRNDPDLEFLQRCDNEDLEILVTYLTKGKNGEIRWHEELTGKEEYKNHCPNHKMYWKEIAAELQTYAGNTFANLRRGDQGILYKKILTEVCKKMKVNFNADSSVELIEINLLMKILIDSLAKMTPEQMQEVVKATGLKTTSFKPEAVAAALQLAVQMSGFTAYKVALIVANAVAKAILGRGLPLVVNAALVRAISILAGPIGWAIAALWTLIDIAGPAYRVTIPSVIHVAYMRAKMNAKE